MHQPKRKSKSSPSKEQLERSAWMALLEQEKRMRHEQVPPGWVDYDQFARKMGTCREVAAMKLRALARAGLCERRDFRVKWGDFIRPRPFFRLKT